MQADAEPGQSTGIIGRAAGVIGANPPANRRLECENGGEKHISRLLPHPDAAPLMAILRSESVKDIFDRYERHDAAAGAAQKRYKRVQVLLLGPLGFALAVGLGSFAIPPGAIARQIEGLVQDRAEAEALVQWATTMAVYVALLALPIVALCLRPEAAYNKWMRERGTAEGLRRKLFEQVMAGRAEPGAIPLPLLKLEYFRRYQVELQEAYARTRGREHERGAAVARWTGRIALAMLLVWGLLCIGANLSGLTEQGPLTTLAALDHPVLWVSGVLQRIETYNADHQMLLLAIAIGALYGLVLLHVSSNASIRNAARYAVLRDNLALLRGEIGAVRKAAAADDEAAVRGYVARVHSVMSQENADWVRLADLDQQRDLSGLSAAPAQSSGQVSTS